MASRSCDACAALEDRVRVLERELGVRRADGQIGAVMHRLGLTVTQARLVLALYRARGRAVSRVSLMDELPLDGGEGSVRTAVHKIREKLGENAITTVEGLGYALPVPLLSRVMAAIEPPSLQDSRG